jgi:cbb3-type cytochrome oxidase subunit 3
LKKIAKKMFTRKKMIFLVFLLLLAGVVWALRVRGRKKKG